ncbi:MAG: hypothetical protein QW039_00480 [Fervidicoccaceae archaeon]
MNREKLIELKKFLEEEIKKRKSEIEHLELLLAFVEGSLGNLKNEEKGGKDENVLEVKSGKETIALIVRAPTNIRAKLLFEVRRDPELLSSIRREIGIIDEGAKVSIMEDKDYVKEISVESKSMSSVVMSGITEALRLLITDIYRENMKKRGEQ